MKLLLDCFEQQVDGISLKEGYESFKKGGVLEFKNLGGGDYEAVVDAFSSTNLVRLHVEGNCSCDCAFLRRGSICPHIVATLFYFQKDLFDDDEGIMPKKPAKPKRPSPAKQFRDLLKTISHEELKKFMQEVSYSYPNIRDSFISRYAHHLYPEYKETYTERVQALIKKYANPYGFVDYVESSPLSRSIRDLIGESSVSFERGNIQKGIYILEAIVEEMTKTLRHADDGKERKKQPRRGKRRNVVAVEKEIRQSSFSVRLGRERAEVFVRFGEGGELTVSRTDERKLSAAVNDGIERVDLRRFFTLAVRHFQNLILSDIYSSSLSASILTCCMLSRSRTVTVPSFSVSKSTVTQYGVPISSWRR